MWLNKGNLERRFGDEDASWILSTLAAFWARPESSKFDYVNNTRLARDNVLAELELFEYRAASELRSGHTEVFGPSPAGHMYLYGFNYGTEVHKLVER